MATFTVTTLNDSINPNDGQLSLREAIELANANKNPGAQDIINFAVSGTINLTHGELTIYELVRIDGDNDANSATRDITINAGGDSRVLHITSGSNMRSSITW